jgi:hypothetical protein
MRHAVIRILPTGFLAIQIRFLAFAVCPDAAAFSNVA